MNQQMPEDIQSLIWKVYFKEHVVNMLIKRVKRVNTYHIALNRRTGLNSIYLKLDTENILSNIFQVCCDYGDINHYNWDEDTAFVNLPDCKRPKYCKHNSRY